MSMSETPMPFTVDNLWDMSTHKTVELLNRYHAALIQIEAMGSRARRRGDPCKVAREALNPLHDPDLTKCPTCGGPADNGHDRCLPPNPYCCTRCQGEIQQFTR